MGNFLWVLAPAQKFMSQCSFACLDLCCFKFSAVAGFVCVCVREREREREITRYSYTVRTFFQNSTTFAIFFLSGTSQEVYLYQQLTTLL
jgi:hypothetical protein